MPQELERGCRVEVSRMKVRRVRIGRLFSNVPRKFENIRVELEFEVDGNPDPRLLAQRFWEEALGLVKNVLLEEARSVAEDLSLDLESKLKETREEREECERRLQELMAKRRELELSLIHI